MTLRTGWPLAFLLMTGCASVSQTVAPLSEAELRAAEAHANGLCLMSEQSGKDAAKRIAGLSDMADVADPTLQFDREIRFVSVGTEMARERGCV